MLYKEMAPCWDPRVSPLILKLVASNADCMQISIFGHNGCIFITIGVHVLYIPRVIRERKLFKLFCVLCTLYIRIISFSMDRSALWKM